MKKIRYLRFLSIGFLCSYPIIGTTEPPLTDTAKITTIEMTNEVLVRDTIPLGINLVTDSYYDPGVLLKVRDAENFEGTSYRQAHVGVLFEDGFASCWSKLPGYEEMGWADLMRQGGQYTLISGPEKWTTGKIAAVSSRVITCWRKEREALFFAFDTKIVLPNQTPIPEMGILVENLEPVKYGHTGQLGSYWAPSENCFLVQDDNPPKSFGYTSLAMDGTQKPATFRLSTHKQKHGNLNSFWKYRFWAKIKEGDPQVLINLGQYGEVQELSISKTTEQYQHAFAGVSELFGEEEPSGLFGEKPGGLFGDGLSGLFEEELSQSFESVGEEISQTLEISGNQWQKYELTFLINDVPEHLTSGDSPFLFFLLTVKNGVLLVDDIEVEMEGDENPTAFRDDIVASLKSYNPGVIRKLQVGGSTIKNTIMPRLQSHRATNSFYIKIGTNQKGKLSAYGLHDFYELAEYIDSEPWFNLPGTLNLEEMKQFMEYLGAPAEVGWGKLRAELGHPQPWTETLRKIHIEIGNEAWNAFGGFRGGGFNGADYWQDLFTTAKNSPYYQKNIILHAAGQNYSSYMSNKILEQTPAADRYAIAPYQLHTLNQRDVDIFNNDAELFSWVFARTLDEIDTKMLGQKQVMDKTGVEFSIYEVNHHTLKGDVAHEVRNHIVSSLGAGLNISNYMLQLLKKYKIRTQAFFNFSQFAFNMAFYGYDNFNVHLWGSGFNFRQDKKRFRPTWLANELVNKVLVGSLLKTIHTGADPTYTITGSFQYDGSPETKEGFPEILSYAFAKGKKRGLILYNLSTTTPQNVVVKFDNNHESFNNSATSWLLTADSIAANNEYENKTLQVQVAETSIERFRSGISITLPRHSLQVISWQASTRPLLVQLTNFDASTETNNVRLSWTTATEVDNAGFRIWRAIEAGEGEYTEITMLRGHNVTQTDCIKGQLISTDKTNQLISAAGNSRRETCYLFQDSIEEGTYYYVLESVDNDGKSTFHCDALDAVVVKQGTAIDLEAARNYCQQVTDEKI